MKLINNIRIRLLFGVFLAGWLFPELGYSQTEQKKTATTAGGYQSNGTLEQVISIGGVSGPILQSASGQVGNAGYLSVDPGSTPVSFAPQSVSVDEKIEVGSTFPLTFGDADNDVLSWEIISGNELGIFSLDQNGVLSTTQEINFEDQAQQTQYVLQIQVTETYESNGTLVAFVPTTITSAVTIDIQDVNDLPVIEAFTASIEENSANTTVVGTVSASDEDNDVLSFSVASSIFTINETSGELTILDNTALDFETANSQSLIVTVTDAQQGISEITATINLNDVPENPVMADQSFSVREVATNGTVVGNIIATDQDAGTVLSYAFDVASDVFEVNTATGQITIKDETKLAYDPTDPATQSYAINATVSDNTTGTALTDNAVLTIDVIQNAAPVILPQTFSIAENALEVSTVGDVLATDAENDAITWSIVSAEFLDLVNLSAITGQMSLKQGAILDFESNSTLTYTVQVTDGDKSSQSVITVNVTNVNESPEITSTGFEVPENTTSGTVISSVEVTDPENDDLTYSIVSGNTNQTFSINASTGEISLNGVVSSEVTQTYDLLVQVSDGSLTTQKSIPVTVTDVNEAPILVDLDFSVNENSPAGTSVGQLIASDPEGTAITYNLESGNESGIFSLNTTTGAITVTDPSKLDFESIQKVDLVVSASDGVLSSEEVIISIFIQDLDEGSPPVAFSPDFTVYQALTDPVILAGYDPDNDPFSVVITRNPDLGTLSSTSDPELWNFAPNGNLSPETIYTDSVNYKLVENTAAALESNEATYRFRFELTDQPQVIQAFEVSASSFDLSWIDPVINDTYRIEVGYFDLSTGTPEQKMLFSDENVSKSTLSIDGTTATYTGTIEAGDHPFIFSGENVFIFVDVITANGFISSASYIYNSSSGGRIEASPDGLFFAFGNQLTVRENATTQLKLQAIELGDFSLNNAAVEILSSPLIGTLGSPSLTETTDRIYTWEVPFESTQQVGGQDSIQFRVFHPARQVFDTAWTRVTVVDVNDQPKIADIVDQQILEDDTLKLSISIADPDSEFEVRVSSNEATNVPVTYADGILTITPVENFAGKVNISVIAEEKNTTEEYVDFESFELEITPVNDAPIVKAVADQSIDEDKEIQIVLAASDVDNSNAVFSYSASTSKPSLLKASIIGSSLQLKPEPNVNGDFKVYVTADDQTGTENAVSVADTFSITINPVNDQPEILKTLSTQNLLTNFPSYTINLSAYFTDVESDTSLVYSVTGNDKVLLSIDDEILNVSLTDGFTGFEDVSVSASDGELSVSQSVTFVVSNASSDISVANAIADFELDEDFATYSLDVSNVYSASNIANPNFTYQLIGSSFISAEVDNTSQLIKFTPTANYNGSEKLYLLGTVDGKTAYDEFTLTVNPVNDAPVLVSIDDQETNEDQSLTDLFVEASDIDNPSSELTLTVTSSDQALVLDSLITVSSTDGGFLITMTPTADQNGTADLYTELSDGTLSQKDTFKLSVIAVNDLPRSTDALLEDAIEDVSYSVVLSSFFTEPDGEPVSIEVVQKPEWLSLVDNELKGIPINDQVGNWSIRLKASDTSQNSIQRVLDFKVENINDAPIVNQALPDIQVFQGSPWNYSLPSGSFQDVDVDDVLTISFDKIPSWSSLSNGSLTGIPDYEDIGSSQVIVTAKDLAGAAISDTFLVEVIFTNYEATVSVSGLSICIGSEGTVTADGAFDYKWYEADSLIQDGGTSLTYLFKDGVQYFVQGKDEQGRTTATRFLVPIEIVAAPEIEVTASGDRLSVTTQDVNLTFQWYNNEGAIVGETEATFNANSSGDYFVIATNASGCSTVSASINYLLSLHDLSRINMYPNPAIEVVRLSDVPIGSSVQVLELSGKTMKELSRNRDSSIQLDVSDLKAGVYFLKITSGSSIQVFKLVKQ